MQSIAHIRESDGQVQTVEEHLHEVRKLAESYGVKLGVKHIAGLAGLLHDLGKYTHQFVEYILAVTDPNSTNKPRRGEVDHSTAGGKLLFELFHNKHHLILDNEGRNQFPPERSSYDKDVPVNGYIPYHLKIQGDNHHWVSKIFHI